MSTRITVTPRGHDWHAHIGDDKRLWAAGRTPSEAVGDLVRSHPEALGIEVVIKDGPRPDVRPR